MYWLMKSIHSLFNRRISTIGVPIQFVRPWKKAENQLEYLCMVIKYNYIHVAQSNALLYTVIDTVSQKVLTHILRFNIKLGGVINYFPAIMGNKIENVTLRNNDWFQFIAMVVRQFLKDKVVNQGFYPCSYLRGTSIDRIPLHQRPKRSSWILWVWIYLPCSNDFLPLL